MKVYILERYEPYEMVEEIINVFATRNLAKNYLKKHFGKLIYDRERKRWEDRDWFYEITEYEVVMEE